MVDLSSLLRKYKLCKISADIKLSDQEYAIVKYIINSLSCTILESRFFIKNNKRMFYISDTNDSIDFDYAIYDDLELIVGDYIKNIHDDGYRYYLFYAIVLEFIHYLYPVETQHINKINLVDGPE